MQRPEEFLDLVDQAIFEGDLAFMPLVQKKRQIPLHDPFEGLNNVHRDGL